MKPNSHFSLFLKILPVLLLLMCKPAQLFCQNGVPLYLSEHTKVSLLTSSPGEDLYAKFGHSAIRITDTLSGQDLVFNYGLFGEKVYMCKDCHDAYYGNVYAFKQKKSKKKHLRLVKS